MNELRRSFDNVADVYDRIRPTYPDALFGDLFSRLPERADVLEVGPGTGQATSSLLAHGARVTAIELGPNMAHLLRRNFDGNDQLEIVVSSFEDAEVAKHSFDAVVSATAYHWVDEAVRLVKPINLLRPDGWLAIIDSVNVIAPSDAGFFARSKFIDDKYGDASESPRLPSPHEVTGFLGTELQNSFLYRTPLIFRYRWDQTYNAEGFGDLLRSYSSTQAMPEVEREDYVGDMIRLVNDEFGGVVTRPLVIALTLAQPEPGFD